MNDPYVVPGVLLLTGTLAKTEVVAKRRNAMLRAEKNFIVFIVIVFLSS